MLGKLSVIERPLLIWIVKGLGGGTCLSNPIFYISDYIRSMECRDGLWPFFMLLLFIALAINRKLSSLTYLGHVLGFLFEKMQGLPLVLYTPIIQNQDYTYS